MPYTLNEGRFDITCTEDRSVNILGLPPRDDGSPLNLVVSRDVLRPGEDLKTCLSRQIRDLSRQVKDFKELLREGGWIGPGDETSFPAIVVYTRFKQNGQAFFQAQCLAQMPGGKLLVITLNSGAAFDEALMKRWKDLLAHFIPAPREAS
ncbi:MAG: DUF1795 domain-containing protein [Azoarcus sp.]|jgi:hypothetical protein|nr:DUF1795 domain-containing protein [Azoarcus sp.]